MHEKLFTSDQKRKWPDVTPKYKQVEDNTKSGLVTRHRNSFQKIQKNSAAKKAHPVEPKDSGRRKCAPQQKVLGYTQQPTATTMTGRGNRGKRNKGTAATTPAGKKPRWDATAMVATPPPIVSTRRGKHFSEEQMRVLQKTNMVAVRVLENKMLRQLGDLEEDILEGITDELSNHSDTVEKLVQIAQELEKRVAELEANQGRLVGTQTAVPPTAAPPTAAPLTEDQIRSRGLYKTLKFVQRRWNVVCQT